MEAMCTFAAVCCGVALFLAGRDRAARIDPKVGKALAAPARFLDVIVVT
jgi:hypothetical protein